MMRILFSPCTVSQSATPSTGTELPSWERERLNTNANLRKPGTRPPHASIRAGILTQATGLCAFSPPYHTLINFLSHTYLLFYLPYLQNTNILRITIQSILILSLFPPTNLLNAHTWPRSHPTYKKIDKLIIAPAVHATFFCHHLKTSRSYRPKNS